MKPYHESETKNCIFFFNLQKGMPIASINNLLNPIRQQNALKTSYLDCNAVESDSLNTVCYDNCSDQHKLIINTQASSNFLISFWQIILMTNSIISYSRTCCPLIKGKKHYIKHTTLKNIKKQSLPLYKKSADLNLSAAVHNVNR